MYIVYLLFGIVGALVGAAVCRWIVAALVPAREPQRKKIIRFGTALPVLCLIWGGCVFVFQGSINVLVLNRDIGIGDGFECPLPHGYKLSCIDTTDIGTVEAVNGGAKLDWVYRMQFTDAFLLVAANTEWIKRFPNNDNYEDEWHIVNLATKRDEIFTKKANFENAARQRNIRLNLETVDHFYREYRFTWFDAFAGLLLIAVPIGLFSKIFMDIRRARLTAVAPSSSN